MLTLFTVRKFLAVVFVLLVAVAWNCAGVAEATIVKFDSALGPINVRLYNSATPLTTANFLNYANGGDWVDTFIHRSVPGFVIQGGGFTYPSDAIGAKSVPQDPAVMNEPGISNLRGTIAMAKLSGNPNSATNQWFFNLSNNSANLDGQNGGFTVFGRVVGSGMTVVDAIAALPRVNAGSPFDTLPLRNYTSGSIKKENLVTFSSISVLNFPEGDYDFNGTVNAADLVVYNSTFGSTTNAAADGNGNGVVDAADYTIWRKTLGQTTGSGMVLGSVPEPATAWLLVLAAGTACGRRFRTRKTG